MTPKVTQPDVSERLEGSRKVLAEVIDQRGVIFDGPQKFSCGAS